MSLENNAKQALEDVFEAIGHAVGAIPLTLRKPTLGKVYELTVLAHVLEELVGRGFVLSFSNPRQKVAFKGGPCALSQADPHFDVAVPGATAPDFQVFVSVEFETTGARHAATPDLSCVHEIDIGVFKAYAPAHPPREDVAMAIECKAVQKFTKAMVRSALGLRKELSVSHGEQPSTLAQALGARDPLVPADPPSEVWLVARDSRVTSYAASPGYHGVICTHVP